MMSLWKRARHVVRPAGWGVADQALSSLTNFVVGIYIARSLDTKEFGAFSLAFATYVIALNASRGLATDPLVVRYNGADVTSWRRAVAKSAGVAITVGLVVGACCVVVGLLLAGSTRAAFLALGITLPGLLLQDSWRFAFFSAGKGGQAFGNDLVWALSLLPLVAAVAATEQSGVFWFVIAWGGSATLAALVGGIQTRLVPRLSNVVGWLVQHRDLGPATLPRTSAGAGPHSCDCRPRLDRGRGCRRLAAGRRAAARPVERPHHGNRPDGRARGGPHAAPVSAAAETILPAAQQPPGWRRRRVGDGAAPTAGGPGGTAPRHVVAACIQAASAGDHYRGPYRLLDWCDDRSAWPWSRLKEPSRTGI